MFHHSGVILGLFHHSMYSQLYMQEQLFKPRQERHQLVPFFLDVPFRKNIVGKIVFSVYVRTSSCVNHMQIPCWEILREVPRL